MKLTKIPCILAFLAIMLMPPLASCSSSNENAPDVPVTPAGNEFDVRVVLPSKINIVLGQPFTFNVTDGKVPSKDDYLLFQASNGQSKKITISEIGDNSFKVVFGKDFAEGSYTVFIRRDDRRKELGKLEIAIVSANIDPAPGANLYGLVTTADGPVEGVVISDGVEVTTTDENGVYNIKSDKKYGYVFMSIPGGYEVASEGVLPKMYTHISSNTEVADRADFQLTKVANPDNYKVLFLGDMHLANRTNDVNEYMVFADDLNKFRSAHAAEKIYAITLGDMTWDQYWYDNKFQLTDYLELVNRLFKGLQIFHTMGNHDNDFLAQNDFDAEVPYRRSIAPNYYSFNIGKVHYIVLDDIDCSSYNGTKDRNYTKGLSNDQLNWVAKDISYVSKSCPVVITAHAPFFRPTTDKLVFHYDHLQGNTDQLLSYLNGYEVHFVTGHTHMNFNVPKSADIIAGRNVTEHNVAAVCSDWWWSAKLTPGVHISTDGTPAGYSVWTVNATKFQNIYKGTGRDENEQFHSYDLNNVSFTSADVPDMPTSYKDINDAFAKYSGAYPPRSDNKVLINVWNWNPNWSITVTTEDGKTLTPTQRWAYDPLHIAALSIKRLNNSGITTKPNFMTEKFNHFFEVTAPDANTDLTITVTDDNGHTWVERMQRPKAFNTDQFKTR